MHVDAHLLVQSRLTDLTCLISTYSIVFCSPGRLIHRIAISLINAGATSTDCFYGSLSLPISALISVTCTGNGMHVVLLLCGILHVSREKSALFCGGKMQFYLWLHFLSGERFQLACFHHLAITAAEGKKPHHVDVWNLRNNFCGCLPFGLSSFWYLQNALESWDRLCWLYLASLDESSVNVCVQTWPSFLPHTH